MPRYLHLLFLFLVVSCRWLRYAPLRVSFVWYVLPREVSGKGSSYYDPAGRMLQVYEYRWLQGQLFTWTKHNVIQSWCMHACNDTKQTALYFALRFRVCSCFCLLVCSCVCVFVCSCVIYVRVFVRTRVFCARVFVCACVGVCACACDRVLRVLVFVCFGCMHMFRSWVCVCVRVFVCSCVHMRFVCVLSFVFCFMCVLFAAGVAAGEEGEAWTASESGRMTVGESRWRWKIFFRTISP